MDTIKRIFGGGPKDERISAQLGPIYKTGFYILLFGVLFDMFTRYNYLAQTDADGTRITSSPIELAVVFAACAIVSGMMAKRGVYTDSLRYTEARTFAEAGCVAPSVGISLLLSVAAVGGRLYNEVRLFGWENVTWAGDAAMLVIMLLMFSGLFVIVQYLCWRDYREREDALMKASEEDEL